MPIERPVDERVYESSDTFGYLKFFLGPDGNVYQLTGRVASGRKSRYGSLRVLKEPEREDHPLKSLAELAAEHNILL